MTDNDTSDAEGGSGLPLTRRQTLAGLGLAGLLGPGELAVAQPGDDSIDLDRHTWSARRRSKYVRYSDGRFESWAEFDDDASESQARSVPLHSVDTMSTVDFVGTTWHPYANPNPDADQSGAWQYTFVASNLSLGQSAFHDGILDHPRFDADDRWGVTVDERQLDYGDTYALLGRPARYAPVGFRLTPGFAVQSHQPEEGENVVENVAVSARRDLNLFRFFDPSALVDDFRLDTGQRQTPDLEETPESGTEAGALDPVGDRIAKTRGDAFADYGEVRRQFAAARAQLSGGSSDGPGINDARKTVQASIGGLANADELARGADDANAVLAGTDDLLTKLGAVEVGVQAALAVGELMDDPRPVDGDELRYFNGFDRDMPAEPGSVGGGVVMFDAYLAPGTTGAFEVTSRMHIDPDAAVFDWTFPTEATLRARWRIRVNAPSADDPSSVDPEELFDAEIVDVAFSSAGNESDRPSEPGFQFPAGWPITGTRFERRPLRPSPAISPGEGVTVEYESAAADGERSGDGSGHDERAEVWRTTGSTTVTFDAHQTVLCSGPIREYAWEVFRVEGGTEVETLADISGPDVTEISVELPTFEAGQTVRVRLTATDEDGEATTSRTLDLERSQPPTAEVSRQFDEPVVDQTLAFDGSTSSTPVGEIDRYAWDVVEVPDAIQEGIEHAPEYVWSGSGATFEFSPYEPGEYVVRLAVTDSRGYVRYDDVEVHVAEPATARIDPAFDTARADQWLSFDGSNSTVPHGTVDRYQWSVAAQPAGADLSPADTTGDAIEASTSSYRLRPPEPGTYAVTLSIDGGSNDGDETTREFEVESASSVDPDISVGVPDDSRDPAAEQSDSGGENESDVDAGFQTLSSPTVGQTVTLDGSDSSVDGDATVSTHEWTISYGDEAVASLEGATVEYAFERAGTATVDLTVTATDDESVSVQQLLDVAPPSDDAVTSVDPDDDGRRDFSEVARYFDGGSRGGPGRGADSSAADVDGNGRVGPNDVASLFERLTGQ